MDLMKENFEKQKMKLIKEEKMMAWDDKLRFFKEALVKHTQLV